MSQQTVHPLDKGRVVVVVDRYPSGQLGPNNQPVMKNRYATVGRATLWPNTNGSVSPNIKIELDTLPIGAVNSIEMSIFWDSDQAAQQTQAPQNQQYQQPTQTSYSQGQQYPRR